MPCSVKGSKSLSWKRACNWYRQVKAELTANYSHIITPQLKTNMSLHNQVEGRGDRLQHLRNSISSSLSTRLSTKRVGSLVPRLHQLWCGWIAFCCLCWQLQALPWYCVDMLRAQEHCGGGVLTTAYPWDPSKWNTLASSATSAVTWK